MREPDEGWITVGEVVAPQGLAGLVRVKPLTDFPERYRSLSRVALVRRGERRLTRVTTARAHPRGLWVLGFEGVQLRAEAEALRGWEVQVPREELPPLQEGAYYLYQIVGARVREEDGAVLGRVEEVLRTGANDVWVVRRPRGRPVYIPALRSVVRAVVPGVEVVVRLPPGLLEEDGG